MKKLFKNLLAVVLGSAMLGNVACSNYDDEIAGLNNRIDELEGKVALKADLEAVQATVNQLAAIDFDAFVTNDELNAAIAKCASKDDIKNFVTGAELEQVVADAVADMEAQIDAAVAGLQTEADVKKLFEEMIAAYDAWAEVQTSVETAIEEALKPYLKSEDAVTIAEVEAAIAEAVADALTVEDVEATIDGWMGENFADYIEPYETKFDAKIEAELEAAKKEIIADAQKANDDLKAELVKMIEDAIEDAEEANEANDTLYIDEEELAEALKEYETKINEIEGRLAALEGRIQSLVWVPSTLTEMESGKVVLADNMFISLIDVADNTKKVEYVLAEPAQTITWQVSPAAIVGQLNEKDIHFDEMSVTRSAANLFSIVGVEFDVEKGLIVVSVEGDENALKTYEATKMPTIALHIDNGNIDYRSEYVAIEYKAGEAVEASIDYTPEAAEVPYNVESVAAFNDATKVVVNEKEATEYGLAVSVEYAVDSEDVVVDENGVVTPAPEKAFVVGATINVTGTWTIKDSEENYLNLVVVDTFTFTQEKAREIAFDSVLDFGWTYGMELPVKGKEIVLKDITKVEYDAIKAAGATLYTLLVKDEAGEWTDLGNTGLVIEYPNSPSVDTDLMTLNVSVGGDFKQGGDYRVMITLPGEKQDLVLYDDFTVAGFEFEPVGLDFAETHIWNGLTNTYVVNYSEDILHQDILHQLWLENKGQLEPYKYTEELFKANLLLLPPVATNASYAELAFTLTADENYFSVVYTNLDDAFAAEKPAEMSYTFYFGENEEMPVVINFEVSLVMPEATMEANPDYVVDGAAKVNTVLTPDTFSVSDKVIAGAYKMEAPEGAEMVYTIAEDLTDVANVPVIDAGILKWNGWEGNSITIKAAVMFYGKELVSETFEASFADPVAAEMTVAPFNATTMTIAPGETIDVAQFFALATATNEASLVVDEGVVTALGANMAGTIKFEGTTPNADLITISGSTITVAETALELQQEYDVTIMATFSYQYGEDRTAEVTIKVQQ